MAVLEKRTNQFLPPVLAPGGVLLLGTQQKFALDRALPVEEILLYVDMVCGATGPTLSGVDNILGIVKKFNLTVNDGDQTYSVVDASGIGLLEYVSECGFNLDADTLEAIALCSAASIANNMVFRICYRIPLVHPAIAEPLRTRMLLPVHTWANDPIITIDFEQSANMLSAGSLSLVQAHIQLVRRVIPDSETAAIIKDGGFIKFDLLEVPNPVAVGISGEQRFNIASPGSYLNLLFRQYLGGASVTRNVLDQSGIGATVATGFAAESRWRLESGLKTLHEWRWKDMRTINGFSRPQNRATQSNSPIIGGALAASTGFCPAATTMLDFLDDGVPGGAVAELGSVLDVNTPVKSGLKMEVIGPVANVATNASTLFIMGHRLYGDLSKFQAVK